jgi:hypothetical protein
MPLRDGLFYGVAKELFSEASRRDGLFYGPFALGLQKGKVQDFARYNTAMHLVFYQGKITRFVSNLINKGLNWLNGMDVEYQSVVHGQRQDRYNLGDEGFIAVTGSDKIPTKTDNLAAALSYGSFAVTGLQKGKTADSDVNDKYAGKPIEKGA